MGEGEAPGERGGKSIFGRLVEWGYKRGVARGFERGVEWGKGVAHA